MAESSLTRAPRMPRPPSSDAFRRGSRIERARWNASVPSHLVPRAEPPDEALRLFRVTLAPMNPQREAIRTMMSALEGPSNDRTSAEARTAARRARVGGALERARTAVNELERLRSDEVGSGPLVVAREHTTAMMTLVHALATTHQELLSRYQQLQMAVAISRSLEMSEQEILKPAGVPREHLDEMLPALSYRSVLRGSLAYDLPGGGECAVCQSTLEPADVVRFLPCRHCFHTACIDPWFERSVHCPSCRASVCSGKA